MSGQYLEAHAFLKTLRDKGVPYTETLLNLMQYAVIEEVAPVVRCKDCVYGEIDDPDFPNQYVCHYYGNIWNDGVHFCSNGEIRNDR